MSAFGGEFNESTQHLLILADEEVCEWRGMHGHGSRRNRRLSCGSAGRAVNVWRTSRERLRGGTRAASIGSWLAMEGLLQRHAGGLWERCGLRSAKRFRGALPPVGRYGGSHRASNDRPQLSAERSDVTAAAAPTAPARLIKRLAAGIAPKALSPGAPCRATMARRAEARAPVVAGADLWLAEAAIPCRPGHASISRNDLSESLYPDTRRAEEGADGALAYNAADAPSQRRHHQERTGTDRRCGFHPRAAGRGRRSRRARPLGRRPSLRSKQHPHRDAGRAPYALCDASQSPEQGHGDRSSRAR